MWNILLVGLWTVCSLACDLNLTTTSVGKPIKFELTFPSDEDGSRTVCFQFQSALNGHYMVRLDYLPNVCLEASNDLPMTWNNSYHSRVRIDRLCRPFCCVVNPHSHTLMYEIRPAYNILDSLVYKYLIDTYIPVIIVLVMAAYWLEKLIYAGVPIVKQE